MKCHATENTYSKNSLVIPQNSVFIGHSSNPAWRYYNTTKSIKFGLKIIPICLTSSISFNHSIPFSSFRNTTNWKELFSYVLGSDWWISGFTPIMLISILVCACNIYIYIYRLIHGLFHIALVISMKPWYRPSGLISVEGWWQGQYEKSHVLIYLSHILPGQITCYCPSQEGNNMLKCYCPANYAFITHTNSVLFQ